MTNGNSGTDSSRTVIAALIAVVVVLFVVVIALCTVIGLQARAPAVGAMEASSILAQAGSVRPTDDEDPHNDRGVMAFASLLITLFGGLMSGLTMAYMSFDELSLKIFEKSGTEFEQRCAARIASLLKRRHLLLVVLLLSNAAAMEALPLCLNRVVDSEAYTIIISVTAVLIFGEVLPQAIFMRFRLVIGAHLHWLAWMLTFLLFPIAYPISAGLDLLLGHDHGTVYTRVGLKELADLHHAKHTGPLMQDEVSMLKGVLELQDNDVSTAMTEFEYTYMLPSDTILDVETIASIKSKGYSRIPIYQDKRENIQGVLLAKQLIALNPAECKPLSSLRLRRMMYVPATTSLFDMLSMLKRGHCVMATIVGPTSKELETYAAAAKAFNQPPPPAPPFVPGQMLQDPGGQPVRGLITLQNIIEAMLGGPINDEDDMPFWEVHQQSRFTRLLMEAVERRRRERAEDAPLTLTLVQDDIGEADPESERPTGVARLFKCLCCRKSSSRQELMPLSPGAASTSSTCGWCCGKGGAVIAEPYQTLV